MIGRRRWGQVSGEDAKSSGQRAAEERAAVTSCWLGQDRWDNQRGRGPDRFLKVCLAAVHNVSDLGSPLALLKRGRTAGRTTSGRQSLKSSINEARFFCLHLRHTRRCRRLCKASRQTPPHPTAESLEMELFYNIRWFVSRRKIFIGYFFTSNACI